MKIPTLLLAALSLMPPGLCAEGQESKPVNVNVNVPAQLRSLQGHLDKSALFNSNSPEIVPEFSPAGILLSTLSPEGKASPDAHLNYRFHGRFGVFIHHINKQTRSQPEVLQLRLLAFNPGKKVASLHRLARSTYLSQPDAPFKPLPALSAHGGELYAGPGDRVTLDYLTGKAFQVDGSPLLVGAGQWLLLDNLEVPVHGLSPALNGRSYLSWFKTSSPLCLFLQASFQASWATAGSAEPFANALAKDQDLVRPRESSLKFPSFPGAKPIIYGRVSGVSRGLTFTGRGHADIVAHKPLSLAFPISTLEGGTFGTKVQAAPMLRRYGDSAFAAHGNYALGYKIRLRVVNHDRLARTVKVSFNCPLKETGAAGKVRQLVYLEPPGKPVFYRGTVKLTDYLSENRPFQGLFHLVLHRGERGEPVYKMNLEPFENRELEFELFYPPDATPPQVLLLESETPEP